MYKVDFFFFFFFFSENYLPIWKINTSIVKNSACYCCGWPPSSYRCSQVLSFGNRSKKKKKSQTNDYCLMLLSCNYYYLPANARSTHDLTGLHIPTWASIVNITKIPALSWHGAINAKIHFYRFQNNRICKLYGLHRLQKKQCNINSERLVIIIISFDWTPVSSVCILLLERYSIIDELYSLFIYGCLPWIFITKTRLFKYNENFTNKKEKNCR